jgi:outer membrane protein assembly factor BamA
MVVKDKITEKAYKKYYIRNIDILVKSNKESLKNAIPNDSVFLDNCTYKSIENPYRPKTITRIVSLKPGEHYSLTDHENTLRYLQGMGAFRSANISFNLVDSSNQLDAQINLIPLKPVQTSLEMTFATKSNDFLGPSAKASIGHMNVFRGAERLILSIDGGFEWQKRSKRREYELGLNSYEIGTQLKLIIPRFLLPFNVKNKSARYVPKTLSSIGFRTLKRVKYYSMNLSQVKFGYAWRSSRKREYKVDAVSIDYLRLTKTSTEFEEFLVQYPQVATSFQEQFIIGSSFSYIYHSNPFKKRRNKFFDNPILDLSGNLINSVYALTGLKDPNSDEPAKLLGAPYAQYVKLTNDFRYYYIFNEKRQIATRFLAGIGIPYNNSSVLPYVKQYFAGGSQGIRAFYARSIGPGSYQSSDTIPSGVFLDQSGEIKLEANLEYRFPITYKTFGALFVDAGNVWLLNDDPSRPGGKFNFNTFLDQIAIGAGLGLRIDIQYFVIRLDVGVPMRKPYKVNNSNWISKNPGFWGDYIISFAIGYPF